MNLDEPKVIEVSCEIDILQNVFNPFSRFVATSLIILVGLAFVYLSAANLVYYPGSVMAWVAAISIIPLSIRYFLFPSRALSLYSDKNPKKLVFSSGKCVAFYESNTYERRIHDLYVKRGIFGTSILTDKTGYGDVVISNTAITRNDLKKLLKEMI